MKYKQNQVTWKLRSVKTQTQYQEGRNQGKLLSALRRNLEGRNMNPIHQHWEEEKIIYTCQNGCGCDVHTDDIQKGYQETFIERGRCHVY